MIIVAALPKCPLCLMAWGGAFASAGAARFATSPAVSVGFAALSAAIFGWYARRNRAPLVAAIGLAVITLVLFRRFL